MSGSYNDSNGDETFCIQSFDEWKQRPTRKVAARKPSHSLQNQSPANRNSPSTKRKFVECPADDLEKVDDLEYSSDEGVLTITDPVKKKRKKQPPLPLDDIPIDIQEIIKVSGIDEILDEKAKKSKLTATHVKNIIKQVIDNPDVNSFLKNISDGIEQENSFSYEPKYTRAKTKEILEQHIKETGDDIQTHLGLSNPTSGIQVYPEVKTLVTEDFPEEDDDDDYDPTADNEGDKSEDEVRFGSPYTPSTPVGSIAATTPSTGRPSGQKSRRQTPLQRSTAMSEHLGKVVQRSLDFSKYPEKELICSRTRSKYPMKDTPVEYLEMQFKPPDITKGMYNNAEDDVHYTEFLREYAMPADDIVAGEDDEASDPDFNVMGQYRISKMDLKEETRDDKAVHVSKKEFSELMTEYLDSFQYDLYDLNDGGSPMSSELNFTQPTIESEFFNSNPNAVGCETPRCDSVISGVLRSNCNTPFQVNQLRETSIPEENFDFVVESPLETPLTGQQSAAPIVVKFMMQRFTSHHLEALKVQMMQHIQLLTTSVLLCHKIKQNTHIALGSRKMLNQLCTCANESGNPSESIFNQWNLRASIDTLSVYDNNQHLDDKCRHQNFEDQRCFTKLLKFVFLNSYAFPFVHLLPWYTYQRPNKNKKTIALKHFRDGEDWLLAQGLHKHFIPKVDRWKGLGERKLIDNCLLRVAKRIHAEKVLLRPAIKIRSRIQHIRTNYERLGKFADNPVLKFLQFGIYEEQPLMPKVPHYVPCPLKNVPESADLPPCWIRYKAEYWSINHKKKPVEVATNSEAETDDSPIFMIVYPNTNNATPNPATMYSSLPNDITYAVDESNIVRQMPQEAGFVVNPSPLVPLCAVTTAESSITHHSVSYAYATNTESIFVADAVIAPQKCQQANVHSYEQYTTGQSLENCTNAEYVATVQHVNDTSEGSCLSVQMGITTQPTETSCNVVDSQLLSMPSITDTPTLLSTESPEPSRCLSSIGDWPPNTGNLSLGMIVESLQLNDMPFLMETPIKTQPQPTILSIETPVIQCNNTTLNTPVKQSDEAIAVAIAQPPVVTPGRRSRNTPKVNSLLEITRKNWDKVSPLKMNLRKSTRKKTRNSHALAESPVKQKPFSTTNGENVDDLDSCDNSHKPVSVKHEVEVFEETDTVEVDRSFTMSEASVNTDISQRSVNHSTVSTPSFKTQDTLPPKKHDSSPLFLIRAKEMLQLKHPAVYQKLIKTLRQYNSSPDAPDKLYLRVQKVLEDFPVLVDQFLLLLNPYQATKISKYDEYCRAIRLNNFLEKFKSHSTKTQNVPTLVKLIQMMQKKSLTQEAIEEFIYKIKTVLHCPHLVNSLRNCFDPAPPLKNFGDIAKEYTGTVSSAAGSDSPSCRCQTGSESCPSPRRRSGKENHQKGGKVVTKRKSYRS